MVTKSVGATYSNISQRAVNSYQRAMAQFTYVPVDGATEMEASQRALHAFFIDLYDHLFEHADRFGLPVGEDSSIGEDEPNAKDKKQKVKKLLDKPRTMIFRALDYLRAVALAGRLDGQSLVVDGYTEVVKTSRVAPRFLDGMAQLGWSVALSGDTAAVGHQRFPDMMPALKALAEGCARIKDEKIGQFSFMRCDFQALQKGYKPDPADFYRFVEGGIQEYLLQLHEYFMEMGYKPLVSVYEQGWLVQYQGDRKIKSSPLFQVEYDDRYQKLVRISIKCASTNRIAGLLPRQSQVLQDDFMAHRYNKCQSPQCTWCQKHKALGPSEIEYKGETLKACWYANPDVKQIDAGAVDLIKQYERMHAELALSQ